MPNIITSNNRIITKGGRVIKSGSIPLVGDLYGGGIVAYILQSGDPGYEAGKTKGLIAATSNQSSGIAWITPPYISISTNSIMGSGLSNTNNIIAIQGINNASVIARAYNGGGYTDWYLPSRDELYFISASAGLIGNFISGAKYWTSTQESINNAFWLQVTDRYGYNIEWAKGNSFRVRPVRSFTIG
jgi:hypothetical protein